MIIPGICLLFIKFSLLYILQEVLNIFIRITYLSNVTYIETACMEEFFPSVILYEVLCDVSAPVTVEH